MGFAELAVADDIDAVVGLDLHHIGHRLAKAVLKAGIIDLIAGFHGGQVLDQRRRADQAAHMGDGDAVVRAHERNVNASSCPGQTLFATAGQVAYDCAK